MHAADGAVDGVLQHALLALQTVQIALDIVGKLRIVEMRIVLAAETLQSLHLLDERTAHVRSQIEIERGDSLTAVHLVLHRLHRDTAYDAGRLDALGGTRLAVARLKTALQNLVERMLYAGERLGGIVILVVDVDIVVAQRGAGLFGEQVIVDEGFGGLAGELHHHARGSVGVHVGVLAGDVVALGLDYLQKYVSRLGLAGDAALVAIGYVTLGDLLAGRVHQLHLHHVLNLLHRRLLGAAALYAVGDLVHQRLVLAPLGGEHGLADRGGYLLAIEAYHASVTFNYCLYHLT